MKILHLYSDWKWTGPAEPVLQMCHSLEQLGHDVLLAYRAPQHENPEESIRMKAEQLDLHRTEQFALDRYLSPRGTMRDLLQLPRFLKKERFDVVNMHLCHDHAFGGICTKFLGSKRPLLVRTLHRRSVLEPTLGYKLQLGKLADGFLVFTESFRQQYITRFDIAPERIAVLPMPIDVDRFSPNQNFRDVRAEFGIQASAPVIGIVGRFQKYRRMDVFMEAAAIVAKAVPEVRFLIIGRSSKMQETVVNPMRELGLENNIILTGYRIEDYVDVMACLDIFTLLMPGFDGTARAVREALALGKPCVVPHFGMLPEIVQHEQTGLVVQNDNAQALATGWLDLIRNHEKSRKLGKNARQDALNRFKIESVGPALEDFYNGLLTLRN